jgi:hypothetical protein
MGWLITNLGVELSIAVVMLGLTTLGSKVSAALPNKNLWRIKDPTTMTICVAESTASETGKYVRPATGIGQVAALAVIAPSIARAYGKIHDGNIKLAARGRPIDRSTDLISLGGGKNNADTSL